MELFAYLLVGAAVGLLCRVIVPPNGQMGLVRCVIVGIVGGIVGGMITGTFVNQEAFAVAVPTIIGAAVLAAVAVFVVAGATRKRVHA